LYGALHVFEVHEGDTFRFGHDASAGIAELRELGSELHFNVASARLAEGARHHGFKQAKCDGGIVAGQLGVARALLGRPFSILSTPVHGRGVGTKLTTPTIKSCTVYRTVAAGWCLCHWRAHWGEGQDAPWRRRGDETRVRGRRSDGAGFAVESHLLDGRQRVELTESTPIEVCFLMRLRGSSASLLRRRSGRRSCGMGKGTAHFSLARARRVDANGRS